MDIISLSQTSVLNFVTIDGSSPKAILEITNKSADQKSAYKIKTTAPKLFVVKPIQGIIGPGRTVSVEIHIQESQAKSDAEILKNKF